MGILKAIYLDKIKGALFGLACGDAMGATTEFLPKNSSEYELGHLVTEIEGGGAFGLKPGQTTDDTQMMICVAKGIMADRKSPTEHIGNEFIKWLNSNPFDVGITCRRTISIKRDYPNISWFEASANTHLFCNGRSAGNGTLMRCLPVGLFYKTKESIERVSRLQSKLTHWDEEASDACIMYNKMVRELISGKTNIKAIIDRNSISEKYGYDNIMSLEYEDLNPTGYVVDSLICALWALTHTKSYRECVTLTTNLCGDADTISAIAGGLAGALYGFKSIPEHWVDIIDVKDELNYIAERVVED